MKYYTFKKLINWIDRINQNDFRLFQLKRIWFPSDIIYILWAFRINHSAKTYLHSRTKNIFLLRKHDIIIFERESACICMTTYCMSKESVIFLSIYAIIFVCQKASLCSSWINLKIPKLTLYVGEVSLHFT